MKALLKAIFGVAAFCALIMTSAPASAQQVEGVYIGPNGFGVYLDSDTRNFHRNRGASAPQRWDRYGDWYADPNRYRPYDRARWNSRDCYPVSRWALDRRGRDVRMVATMCYRRNGQTYVVPGSERRVR